MGLVSTDDLFSPEVFRYLRIQGADFFAVSGAMNSEIGVTSWRLMLMQQYLRLIKVAFTKIWAC